MTEEKRGFSYWVRRIWGNYVVRNIVLGVAALVALVVLVSLLLNVFTRHNSYTGVPDFLGLNMEDAGGLANTDKFRIEISDSLYVPTFTPGIILDQNPEPGTKVKSGRRIFVTVNSYTQKIVDVPYVVGFSLRQAKNLLDTEELEIEKLVYVDDIATNNVLGQWIGETAVTRASNMKAPVGTGVTLQVGRMRDAAPVVVPNITGISLHEAQNRLWEVGLNVGRIAQNDDINKGNQQGARVYLQNPEPNNYMPLGTDVSLWLTLDNEQLRKGVQEAAVISRHNMRSRFLSDSLTRAGFPADLLQGEVEYLLRWENGTLTAADSVRTARELLQDVVPETYYEEE